MSYLRHETRRPEGNREGWQVVVCNAVVEGAAFNGSRASKHTSVFIPPFPCEDDRGEFGLAEASGAASEPTRELGKDANCENCPYL